MDQKLKKLQGRVLQVGAYGLHQILSPLGQFLISYVVIVFHSSELWGQLVEQLILVNLAAMFFTWGQNTYVIRAVSQQPKDLQKEWQSAFTTRLVLLLLTLLMIAIMNRDNLEVLFLLNAWVLGTYLYRAFDPIHLIVRNFKKAIVVEFLALGIFLFLFLLFRFELNLIILLRLYVLLAFAKALGYLILYRKVLFNQKEWRFKSTFFKAAFPFFIPAFVGFIQARIDLYGVAFYLDDKTLGEYQIFFKILLLFVLGSKIIISPFLKNIYRMPMDALVGMNRKIFLGGALISLPLIVLIYFLLPLVYGIEFSYQLYVAGYCMIVPYFGYVMKTHQLIRSHQESRMAWGFFFAACCNLCCNYILIPNYGALGAIISTAIVQWMLLALFSYWTK